jgi:hypothetical protein
MCAQAYRLAAARAPENADEKESFPVVAASAVPFPGKRGDARLWRSNLTEPHEALEVSETTVTPGAEGADGQPSRAPALAAGVGAIGVAILAVGIVALALFLRDDTNRYPTGLGDDNYNLEAMVLASSDMPAGIHKRQEKGFDNEEWSQIFDTDDPAAKKSQLDAQGRLRNHVAYFSWDQPMEHLGRPISVTTQSTLYVDAKSASEAARKFACGLLVADKDPIDEFKVPKLGDQAVGFFVIQEQQNFGKTIDTAVCFRTGRILHAVVQSGLEGTEDVALSVKLAEKMLVRVDAAFAGKPMPVEELVPDQG